MCFRGLLSSEQLLKKSLRNEFKTPKKKIAQGLLNRCKCNFNLWKLTLCWKFSCFYCTVQQCFNFSSKLSWLFAHICAQVIDFPYSSFSRSLSVQAQKFPDICTVVNNRESLRKNCLGLWLVWNESPQFLVWGMLSPKILLCLLFEDFSPFLYHFM